MKNLSSLWVLLLSLSLFACGGGSDSSSGGGAAYDGIQATKIVAIGDSIGARELSWPTVVGQMSGVGVSNYSQDGLQTGDFVGRVQGILAAEKPSHLLILLGTNDARNYIVQGAVSNLQAMVDMANSAGVVAVVGTIPPNLRDARVDALAASISSGIRGLSGARVAYVREGLAGGAGLFPDGLHPNAEGSRIIGAAFAAQL